MNAIAAEPSPLARRRASPVQTYAKIAGVLLLLSFIAGGFGEPYVPSKLVVATDAAATVENLKSSDIMFRLGFAGYLVRHRTSESHARSALESIQLAVRDNLRPGLGGPSFAPTLVAGGKGRRGLQPPTSSAATASRSGKRKQEHRRSGNRSASQCHAAGPSAPGSDQTT